MRIPVASKTRRGNHIVFRRQQIVLLCKGGKQAACGFRFDFAAKCRAA